MADDGTTDVMTTPEQVLAAGGVSKRRRGTSSSKRRSPSGRRAPTPEPPKELLLDLEKADEAQADDSPSATEVMIVTKRRSTKEKTLVTKRSLSSPGEGRQPLVETSDLKTQSPIITTETTVIRRRSSSSNAPRNEEIPVLATITTSAFLEKVPAPSPILKPIPIKSIRPTEFTTDEVFLPAVQSQEPEAPSLTEVAVKQTEAPVVQKEEVMVIKKEIVPTVRKEEIVVTTEVLKEKKEEKKDQEAVIKPEVIVKKVIQEVTVKEKKAEEIPEVRKIKELEVEEKKIEEKAVEKRKEEKEKPGKKEEKEKPKKKEVKEKPRKEEEKEKPEVVDSKSLPEKTPEVKEAVWGPFFREVREEWGKFVVQHNEQWQKIVSQRNRCIGAFLLMFIYCGLGGLIFRFTEGAFEAFYKCGVKRVKRDFIDSLWLGSHNLKEDDWKSQARKKLMELENQLHAAHDAGVTTYSGQRAWSFLNAIVYCLTVVTTIGYGHISPSTTTGRAITIVYAIFGIPLFLILLADFGKLFTRGIKFVWAFVRRLYYTGSCKKVRRTVPVQEVMKGVQLVYDFATFRRPSQIVEGTEIRTAPIAKPEDVELQIPLNQNQAVQLHPQEQQNQQPTSLPLDGHEVPGTPAISAFEVDDEFNLPISVAITILLIYIFVGATIYWTWEEWGFFESFYFVFISMSTIGFGDFVPQHPMYMMASIVYLVFGLALTSMCINVVQEKLSDSFRQASAKLGATIGLRVNEEDGSITPVAAVPLETNEVQNALPKSHST